MYNEVLHVVVGGEDIFRNFNKDHTLKCEKKEYLFIRFSPSMAMKPTPSVVIAECIAS